MRLCRIGNGTIITCRACKEKGIRKTHKIRGYTGNNERWEDSCGWLGEWSTELGDFSSEMTNSYCPEHAEEME